MPAINVNPQFVLILVMPLLGVGVGWLIWLTFDVIGNVIVNVWDKLGL